MSVLSEKQGVVALCKAVLGARFPAAANNVYTDLLDDPYEGTFPAFVVRRTHYTATETAAGLQRGNDDGDPNQYELDYYDTLTSISGATLPATMDAHDQILDDLIVACMTNPWATLMIAGVSHAEKAGETITSNSREEGPYQLRSGTSAILSTITLAVKQTYRYP